MHWIGIREKERKEVHPNVDQFFCIEQGEAKFVFDARQEHMVSPPSHRDGTVHKTKSMAEAAEHHR